MSLVYRSITSTALDTDISREAAAALSEWLSRRGSTGAAVDFTRTGRYQLSSRARAAVIRRDEDARTLLRLTTETERQDARWRTTVTVATGTDRTGGHLWADMTAHPAADGPGRIEASPPEAVRILLSRLDCRDGRHPVSGEPRIVRGRSDDAVRRLADAVRDPDRRLALVVAGRPARGTVSDWRAALASALSRSAGMYTGYVLDGAAHDRLYGLLPRDLRVPRGGIRTYLPRVQRDAADDARRHPLMSPSTVAAASGPDGRLHGWAARTLTRAIRETALAAALPAELQQVDALLNEAELDAFLGSAGPDTGPSAPATSDAEAAAHIALLRRRLAAASREAGRLGAEAERQGARARRLGEQAEAAEAERERLWADLSETEEEVDAARSALQSARGELAWLRGRLREEGLHRLAGERPPADHLSSVPESVEELLDRITDGTALPHLFFTLADRSTVRELTDSNKEGLWARRTWEALRALDDYARYQLENPGTGLGLHEYLRQPPDGYAAVPVRRLASGESDSVRRRDKLSDKRIFPVPAEVDPSGEAPMYAHFRLDGEYGICPRLYFLPDLGPGTTNRIYIGYIGRHLPVHSTN